MREQSNSNYNWNISSTCLKWKYARGRKNVAREGVDRDGGGETRGNQSDYKDWKHHVHIKGEGQESGTPHFFFLTGCSLQNYFSFIRGCEKKRIKKQ